MFDILEWNIIDNNRFIIILLYIRVFKVMIIFVIVKVICLYNI